MKKGEAKFTIDDVELEDQTVPCHVRTMIVFLEGLEYGRLLTGAKVRGETKLSSCIFKNNSGNKALDPYKAHGNIDGKRVSYWGNPKTIAAYKARVSHE